MRDLQADVTASPGGMTEVVRRDDRGPQARGWVSRAAVVVIPALAELVVGGYRLAGPSLWRDEAATISGSQRPVSAIMAMLPNEDAVHGPYYLLMHEVIAVGGISATVLRLPSLIAMCLAVALTAALGQRLARSSGLPAARAVGLLAGLTLTALPITTRYAQEARPTALATLFAVAATCLLAQAAGGARRRWWVLYAAALVLAGLFNLFAVLLAAAHGVSLLAARRAAPPGGEVAVGAMRRWLIACVAAAVVLAPMVYLSARQSAQLNWVTTPGMSALATLIRDFAGAMLLIPAVVLLGWLGCVAGRGVRRGGLTLAVVTLPWLVLPPVVLLAVSLVHPVYVERYVVFCLPALAVLTSAGLVWLVPLARQAAALRGLGGRSVFVLAVAPSALLALLVVLALIGPQRGIRLATSRADNLRAVAAVVASRERPGDAILYLPWKTELVGVAYQVPFRKLRDIGIAESPVAAATLRGLPASPAVVAARLGGVRRLWTVRWADPLTPDGAAPASLTRLLTRMRLIGQWRIQSVVLGLYVAG